MTEDLMVDNIPARVARDQAEIVDQLGEHDIEQIFKVAAVTQCRVIGPPGLQIRLEDLARLVDSGNKVFHLRDLLQIALPCAAVAIQIQLRLNQITLLVEAAQKRITRLLDVGLVPVEDEKLGDLFGKPVGCGRGQVDVANELVRGLELAPVVVGTGQRHDNAQACKCHRGQLGRMTEHEFRSDPHDDLPGVRRRWSGRRVISAQSFARMRDFLPEIAAFAWSEQPARTSLVPF
jgi:hypothetical protein